MPGILIDTYAPVRRQREKVDALDARLFKLRREREDAQRELERLVAEHARAEAARRTK